MRWRGIVALVAITGCSAVHTPSPGGLRPSVARGDVEEGLASWYGPGFHGKRTANGEIYDQEDMTAAHKTLPLGSMVQVTNLANDRALDLRVNDRGPFVDGRIIDLSKGAARALGVLGPGTAPVTVRVLAYGDNKYAKVPRGVLASGTGRENRPAPVVVAAAAPPPAPVYAAPAPAYRPIPIRVATPPPPPEPTFTVQIATLSDADRAQHLANVLRERFPSTRVNPVTSGERRGFQVEIGPFAGQSTAREQAARVTRLGYPAVIAQAE